ncbi:MAG TPA: lytic transglycosylase domain-containing protein [Thermotogaceae bacterium]|nr:lytic transglycosylase domain-containing protein [Thermotogaceae bacterium]
MRFFILVLFMFFIEFGNPIFATFYELNLSNSGAIEAILSQKISPSGMIFQSSSTFELGFHSENLWFQYTDFFRFTLPITTKIFNKTAKKYGIDPALLKAMIRVESSFFIHAVSKSNARGLMQLKFITARENGALNSFSIIQNVEAGCNYLSKLYKKFKSWDKAIAAYYVGPTTVKNRGITENARTYVKKVKKYWNYYKRTNKNENLRDLIWWSTGMELDIKGLKNLNLSFAIPVLGLCEFGTSVIISDKPTVILNPSFHLTDQISIGLSYDFKGSPIYSIKFQPSANDYHMFISSNFFDTLSFGLLIEKKFYSILFGAGENGLSAGFVLNFDSIGFCGGFKNGFNTAIIFKPRNPW